MRSFYLVVFLLLLFFRIDEITKSLESLDTIIDDYEDAKSLRGTESKILELADEDDSFKDLYDDAFSVQIAKGKNYIEH